MLSLVATVVVAALGVAGSVAARSAPTAAAGLCIATGAATVLNDESTTKYEVKLTGVTCSFAKPWVSRLSKKPNVFKNRRPHIAGGPRGYNCYGGPTASPRTPLGQCWKLKTSVPKYFVWGPYIAGMTG